MKMILPPMASLTVGRCGRLRPPGGRGFGLAHPTHVEGDPGVGHGVRAVAAIPSDRRRAYRVARGLGGSLGGREAALRAGGLLAGRRAALAAVPLLCAFSRAGRTVGPRSCDEQSCRPDREQMLHHAVSLTPVHAEAFLFLSS